MQRISSYLPSDNMQYHLRRREWRMNESSEMMGSQTRIKNLRDDPLGAGRAVRFQSASVRAQRYSDNIELLHSHMAFMEGYTMEAVDVLQRVNEIAVQAGNGLYDKDQMAYMATEVDELLKELIVIGNSRSEDGTSLFAGNRVKSDAFRLSHAPVPGAESEKIAGVEYIGNIGQNQVEISEGAFAPYNLAGNQVFWAENQQIYSAVPATEYRVQEDADIRIDGVDIALRAGDNVYGIISKINDSAASVRARLDPVSNSLVLETTSPHQIWPEDAGGGTVLQELGILSSTGGLPPQNISDSARVYGGSVFDMVIHLRDSLYEGNHIDSGGSGLRGIQDAIENMVGVLAKIGAQDTRLRATGDRLSSEIDELEGMASREVDLDLTQAITEFKTLEYTHKAALAVTARIVKQSLLDFLR